MELLVFSGFSDISDFSDFSDVHSLRRESTTLRRFSFELLSLETGISRCACSVSEDSAESAGVGGRALSIAGVVTVIVYGV